MKLEAGPSKIGKNSNTRVFLKEVSKVLPMVFLVFLILICGIFIFSARKQKQSIDEERKNQTKTEQVPINVVALNLVPTDIRDRISFPGKVEPWVSLDVLSEVAGKVEKRIVKEGDMVEKSDVIALIDSRDYEIAYNDAKASFDAATSSLARFETLYKERLTARANLDNAVAEKERAKAALDIAGLNLSRCKIAAPISGVINQMHVEEGQFLNRSDSVAQILKMDRVKITVGVPESDVEAVRAISDFSITIDAIKGKAFPGKKYYLSRTAESQAHLYNLSISLDNPSDEILPDMFARVEIVKSDVKDVMVLPLYAVLTRNNRNFVYVAKEDKAHEKEVFLGIRQGWRIQVTGGLEWDDKVIIVGQRNLSSGQSVSVVRKVDDPEELND